MNINELRPLFEGKRCAILGYGREGRVWLSLLNRLGCCSEIAVADMKPQDIPGVTGIYGEDCLDRAKGYDLLLQSPGVIIKDKLTDEEKSRILTQTEVLLRLRPCKIIGITGTNGKTTTANMINDILADNGYSPVNNRAGSNILGGVATTLISAVNLRGKTVKDLAVLELDERSSRLIYPYVHPTYLLCTNLFRDSYKRNAHSEFIFDILDKHIPKQTKLVLNADDLVSARLAKGNDRVYFLSLIHI